MAHSKSKKSHPFLLKDVYQKKLNKIYQKNQINCKRVYLCGVVQRKRSAHIKLARAYCVQMFPKVTTTPHHHHTTTHHATPHHHSTTQHATQHHPPHPHLSNFTQNTTLIRGRLKLVATKAYSTSSSASNTKQVF
jgi:hypothetical protein